MIKPSHLLVLLSLCLSIFGLFQIKFKVQNLNREMVELQKQLEHEKNSIHVLKAEWAYLNQPERLQHLAEKHLHLAEVKSEQIMLAAPGTMIIAQVKETTSIAEANSNLIKTSMTKAAPQKTTPIKWRYRERPEMLMRRKK